MNAVTLNRKGAVVSNSCNSCEKSAWTCWQPCLIEREFLYQWDEEGMKGLNSNGMGSLTSMVKGIQITADLINK